MVKGECGGWRQRKGGSKGGMGEERRYGLGERRRGMGEEGFER